ncbi:hypothetical protein DFP72DRAFT_1172348 [Ephemerocybe angulata]|uniref:Uncharacterized protein n=1 Tax=Ephemerocybe angulata TaxID=980116 RepID=A0A8H6M3V8_9AGAR|nr:hypothetical protein DFP72DRAFT_1172348 [Tulosesus angulatus]
MSAAQARAEARRKAILSRGSDRLAKLTTSARGEDAPAYMKDVGASSSVSSSSARAFLGEETLDMPPPTGLSSIASSSSSPSSSPQPPKQRNVSSTSTSSASSFRHTTASNASTPPPNPFEALSSLGAGGPAPDPNVWSAEQQQQFMRALMAGAAGGGAIGAPGQTPLQSPLGDPDAADPGLPPMDNPLAAMLMGGLGGTGGAGGMPGFGGPGMGGPPGMDLASMFGGPQGPGVKEVAKPPSKWAKFMPFVHLLAVWSLLGYFVLFFEPKVYATASGDELPVHGVWRRWSYLARGAAGVSVPEKVVVQGAPFFWYFMTLEVMLHSIQIFMGSNAVQPPALLALALPHIPPPFPSLIINSLKYIRMLSMFVDDIAGLVVGLGFVVYFAGLFN